MYPSPVRCTIVQYLAYNILYSHDTGLPSQLASLAKHDQGRDTADSKPLSSSASTLTVGNAPVHPQPAGDSGIPIGDLLDSGLAVRALSNSLRVFIAPNVS